MTDREMIIDNFVEKYFMICDSPHNLGIRRPLGVKTKDGRLGGLEFSNPTNFTLFVCSLYSDYLTDEKIYVSYMVQKWFNEKYDTMYGTINNYLDSNIKISLGPRSWLVEMNGEAWNWKELHKVFEGVYSEKILKMIYTSWYDNRVLEISEQHMNEPFY